MNDVKDSPSAENNVAHLEAECACLRQQVWMLLVLMVVISGTVTIYLFRQAVITRKDVEQLRPQIQQGMQLFSQKRAELENWAKQLNAYATTHPDFLPILVKYGFTPVTPSATNSPPKK